MDEKQIQSRIEDLKIQRDNLVNQVNAELRHIQDSIQKAQQRHAELLAKGGQDAANLTGRIEELESLLKQQG